MSKTVAKTTLVRNINADLEYLKGLLDNIDPNAQNNYYLLLNTDTYKYLNQNFGNSDNTLFGFKLQINDEPKTNEVYLMNELVDTTDNSKLPYLPREVKRETGNEIQVTPKEVVVKFWDTTLNTESLQVSFDSKQRFLTVKWEYKDKEYKRVFYINCQNIDVNNLSADYGDFWLRIKLPREVVEAGEAINIEVKPRVETDKSCGNTSKKDKDHAEKVDKALLKFQDGVNSLKNKQHSFFDYIENKIAEYNTPRICKCGCRARADLNAHGSDLFEHLLRRIGKI